MPNRFHFPQGDWTPEFIDEHVRPLFVQPEGQVVYLANHSLGRMCKAVPDSMQEMASIWGSKLDRSWEDWMEATVRFRSGIAELIGAESGDRIVPKTSTGQGVRAVLNALHAKLGRKVRVLSTSGEFDSADFIMRVYREAGLIDLTMVEPELTNSMPMYSAETIVNNVADDDLVLISHVFFGTGQILKNIQSITESTHDNGALVLLDTYHSAGVIPVDVQSLGVDFAVGGCYKYLRGGPGSCFLYIAPGARTESLMPIDTGWFAKRNVFSYERPEVPEFADGGDAWLESTPPVATIYQSLPGLELTLAIGVERTRKLTLDRITSIQKTFEHHGIPLFNPQNIEDFGAFALLPHHSAAEVAERLAQKGVVVDARGGFVRYGPDILTTDNEIRAASKETKAVLSELG